MEVYMKKTKKNKKSKKQKIKKSKKQKIKKTKNQKNKKTKNQKNKKQKYESFVFFTSDKVECVSCPFRGSILLGISVKSNMCVNVLELTKSFTQDDSYENQYHL